MKKKVDRTGWPAGPWDTEGDGEEWVSDPLGIPIRCSISRTPVVGNLCGYVFVTKDHPWARQKADGAPDHALDIAVHGGVTYTKMFADCMQVGFDCAHAGDRLPSETATPRPSWPYRDMAYVRAEVERLAQQARDALGDIVEYVVNEEKKREKKPGVE